MRKQEAWAGAGTLATAIVINEVSKKTRGKSLLDSHTDTRIEPVTVKDGVKMTKNIRKIAEKFQGLT